MKLTNSQMESIYFAIEVGGNPLPDQVNALIQRISFESPDTGADTFTIEVSDTLYYFLNDPRLFEDLPIKAQFGYLNASLLEFEGYVASVSAKFSTLGVPDVSIFCMDESHKLNKKKRIRTFSNVKVSDIVRSIAQENGLRAEVEETDDIYEKLAQTQETDMQFLLKLVAGENNGTFLKQGTPFRERKYVCKIVGGVLRFYERKTTNDAQRTLWYNEGDSSLISFEPTFVTNVRVENDTSTNGSKSPSSESTIDPETGKIVPAVPDEKDRKHFDPKSKSWETIEPPRRATGQAR